MFRGFSIVLCALAALSASIANANTLVPEIPPAYAGTRWVEVSGLATHADVEIRTKIRGDANLTDSCTAVECELVIGSVGNVSASQVLVRLDMDLVPGQELWALAKSGGVSRESLPVIVDPLLQPLSVPKVKGGISQVTGNAHCIKLDNLTPYATAKVVTSGN